MVSEEGSILVGCFEDVAWVRVNGNGSHANSHLVRDFADRCVGKGKRNIVVDLENCPGVDSTFIGILTGINLSIEESGKSGGVEVLNANERNVQAICKLGLDSVIKMDREGTSWPEERKLVAENVSKPLPATELDVRERAELMLEAHEALVDANEENCCRFRDVLEYLKKDLESGAA
ncbi:MAG: STAS domain-containing protein [Verrucomicrobiales bacterium]|nr:STAS domain-containing protein [Verrucomicrobiales bacterium]